MTTRLRAAVAAASLLAAASVAANVCFLLPRLESGPYVVGVTGGSAIVCRVHANELRSELLTGLTPTAAQRVEAPFGGWASFRTGRARGEGFTFVALGDGGVTRDIASLPVPTATQTALGDLMAASRPDFFIHLGDVTYYHSERRNFGRQFFEPFAPLLRQSVFFPTSGNHDTRDGYRSAFFELFPWPGGENRFYSFDWGDVHFVSLDGHDDEVQNLPPEQYPWLAKDLAALPEGTPIVFFQHFPMYSSGVHGCFDKAPGVGQRLLPLMTKYGVKLFLNGHDHDYERTSAIAGTVYITTGGGGGELDGFSTLPPSWSAARAKRHHFTRFTVAPGAASLAVEAVGVDGEVFDRATVPLR